MLTVKQVVEANMVLTELVNKDSKPKNEDGGFLPYQTRLRIATLLRKFKNDNESFVKERQELVQKYGVPITTPITEEEVKAGKEPVITGWQVPSDSPNYKEFNEFFTALLECEAELDAIKPLAQDSLGENNLPVGFLMQLQQVGVLAPDVE